MLARRDVYLFAGLLGERPVGFLCAYRFPATELGGHLVYLHDVVVEKGSRRRGIATAMIQALKRRCARDGVRRIWAGTARENTATRRLFTKTGAEQVRETYVEYNFRLRRRRRRGLGRRPGC